MFDEKIIVQCKNCAVNILFSDFEEMDDMITQIFSALNDLQEHGDIEIYYKDEDRESKIFEIKKDENVEDSFFYDTMLENLRIHYEK